MEGTQGVSYRAWVVCLGHVRRKNRGGRTENSSRLLPFLPLCATILEPYLLMKEIFEVLAPVYKKCHIPKMLNILIFFPFAVCCFLEGTVLHLLILHLSFFVQVRTTRKIKN